MMKMTTVMRMMTFMLMFFMAGAAVAKTQTFKKAGSWEAWGGTSDNGEKVCGVDAEGTDRWIGIKYFKGDTSVAIQLTKDTWDAKKGDKVDVSMQFDKLSPWTATATAFVMSSGKIGLEIDIPSDKLEPWFTEFAASRVLYVHFPGSSVDSWQADLTGSQSIANAMVTCIGWMAE